MFRTYYTGIAFAGGSLVLIYLLGYAWMI